MRAATITIQKAGIYQKIILGMFEKMTEGRLQLILPDGEERVFGNGGNISASIIVRHTDFFRRCVLYGDIGFGESYVDGEWDSENLPELIRWLILNIDNIPVVSGSKRKNVLINFLSFINKLYHSRRKNHHTGSRKNISEHYDLSNEFFSLFLDADLTYSSAYFKSPDISLEDAQVAKYQRLCSQLHLSPQDNVLEIGTGWGANAIYIATNYGCQVTTVTISEQQYNFTKKKVLEKGLDDKITVLLKDYRDIEGSFDKIVSIEMLEAVGAEYYPAYFKKCNSLLKKNGLFGIQVITCPDPRFTQFKNSVDWIQKHIFPGSLLPSVGAINTAVNKVTDFSLLDLKDLGTDYAKTLNIWKHQFQKNIPEIKSIGFDDSFIRKWNYYFSYCEAAFASRNISVVQMIYSRANNTSH